jgi:putative Holliday junction resolvase
VQTRPGRALGLDLGDRRIGVALSDSARSLASPYEIVERSGDPDRDRRRVAAMVEETGATVVVVGLPINLDGSMGASARAAVAESAALGALLAVPVETCDERLTTVEVERRRLENATLAGLERRGGRGARRRSPYGASPRRSRQLVDDAAAALMLQAWLDGTRAAGAQP